MGEQELLDWNLNSDAVWFGAGVMNCGVSDLQEEKSWHNG